MKIKEVYPVIKANLGPWFAKNGYKTKGGSGRLLWVKADGKRFRLILFFGDKYGYMPHRGGEIGLKATLAGQAKVTNDDWNDAHFLASIVDDEGLQTMNKIRNKVIRKIVGQKQKDMTEFEKSLFRSSAGIMRIQLTLPWQRNHENYLPYLDIADVEAWCSFIESVLPDINHAISSKTWRPLRG